MLKNENFGVDLDPSQTLQNQGSCRTPKAFSGVQSFVCKKPPLWRAINVQQQQFPSPGTSTGSKSMPTMRVKKSSLFFHRRRRLSRSSCHSLSESSRASAALAVAKWIRFSIFSFRGRQSANSTNKIDTKDNKGWNHAGNISPFVFRRCLHPNIHSFSMLQFIGIYTISGRVIYLDLV